MNRNAPCPGCEGVRRLRRGGGYRARSGVWLLLGVLLAGPGPATAAQDTGADVRIEREAAAATGQPSAGTPPPARFVSRSAPDEAVRTDEWERRDAAGTWVHRVPGARPQGTVVLLVGPGESPHAGLAGYLRRALARQGWVTLAAALPESAEAGGVTAAIDAAAASERVRSLLAEAHGEATPVMLLALGAAVHHESVWLESIPVLPVEDPDGADAGGDGTRQVRQAMAGYVRIGLLDDVPRRYHDSRLATLLLQPGGRIAPAWWALVARNERLTVQRWPPSRTDTDMARTARRVEGWLQTRRSALLGDG